MDKYELIASAIVVPLVSFLKRDMEVEGKIALIISLLLSLIAAVIVYILEEGPNFKAENLLFTMARVFAGAQVIYNLVKQTPLEKVLR